MISHPSRGGLLAVLEAAAPLRGAEWFARLPHEFVGRIRGIAGVSQHAREGDSVAIGIPERVRPLLVSPLRQGAKDAHLDNSRLPRPLGPAAFRNPIIHDPRNAFFSNRPTPPMQTVLASVDPRHELADRGEF